MGDGQDHDHYVEQLREVFNSFDSSGAGSLSLDELSHLCQSLHLDEATPTLLQALLQNHDTLEARVDFEQFKNALILVLSSTIEQPQVEPEPLPKPASPEIQPKFVKGSKRYGRRSTPEFIESASDLSEVPTPHPIIDFEDHYDSAIPAKRERWNAHETSTGEEYEAEGQMHLWNPDEPSTPRGSVVSLSGRFEERLHDACDDMALSWDGLASHSELLALCEHLGIELTGDVLQTLNGDEAMSVQEFVSRVVNHNKPPTPSASTPYRQLKRMHSTQPFDEVGRRIATPSALTSTIGLKLFSTLDDGTGFTPVEHILDTWMEEGIENSTEILQALNFNLDGKLSLNDLTMALENELLVTKNGIHQAALASFKAEIRHLKECADQELREKEKVQSDLEKAERLKTQLAAEVDEHHSAIEQMNKLNLRKLEQDHKDKLASVRSELMKEMEQMQQQNSLQREELEAEIEKIREDETFLRDHLSISVKENRRLEMDLLDTAEKLLDSQNQITKLQTNLDNIMKEKFGDLDPGSAEVFLQEERIKQLHNSYEAQCRELQDRIDELQSELQEFHSIGRVHQPCSKPLSEDLESKSPGMESDPGIGSEEVQPFSMSLEAEMRLEQLKGLHLQEMEELRDQLESKIHECEDLVEKQRASQEKQKAALVQEHQQELQSLKEAMSSLQSHAEELQRQLDQAGLERSSMEQKQAEEIETLQEEEVQTLRQQLLEAHFKNTDLDDQLRSLGEQQTEMNDSFNKEMEELKANHADEIAKLEQTQAEMFKGKMEDEKSRLLSEFESEREDLKKNYENELQAKLDQAELKFDKEQNELVQKLTEQWQKERLQLDEQNTETLQALLEEEMLKLVKEHEEKENKLREQWESEKQHIQQQHEDDLLQRLHQQTIEFEQREKKLREDWEREQLQLEEDYEGMVQERVMEEKDKMEAEKEETEKRFERLMEEERDRLQEKHQEKVKELTGKHKQEREELSSTLDELREDIMRERRQIEASFSQRLKEVEERFIFDQETVTERFQGDVLRLEQHYQRELKTLCENHMKEKCQWEEQMQNVMENAEEQRQKMAAILEQERQKVTEEWTSEVQEIENVHKEEIEALVLKNEDLQSELDETVRQGQLKEIELSKQLNELHNRLQESLERKEELVSQARKQAHETVQDLRREREELLTNQSELEAKYKEIVSISEKQIMERIELLTETDDLKIKLEELEMMLKQAAIDFELERKEMQGTICELIEKLKLSDSQENNCDDLLVERDMLRSKIKELEVEVSQVLTFVEKNNKNGTEEDTSLIDAKGETENASNEKAATEVASKFSDSFSSMDIEGTDDLEAMDSPIEDLAIDIHTNKVNESESSEEDNMASVEDLELTEHDIINGKQCPYVDICEGNTEIDCEEVIFPTSVEASLDLNLPPCPDQKPQWNDLAFENTPEAMSLHGICENSAVVYQPGELKGAGLAKDENSCESEAFSEAGPQNVPDLEIVKTLHEDGCYHEIVVDVLSPRETKDLGQWLEEDDSDSCLSKSHKDIPEITLDLIYCTDTNCNDQDMIKLKTLYNTASEENILLHEKISLLQQKIEILENLLAHNNEKLKTGHQVLEENYSLKVKLLLLMEHIKELERKVLKMADMQIQYEDCLCENGKLKEQNTDLEKQVCSLESLLNEYCGFQDRQASLVDEISRMKEENLKLSSMLDELERPNTKFCTVYPESRTSPIHEDMLDFNGKLKEQKVADLEDCCFEFEKHNTKLRRAITQLQDESQTMTDTTQAYRSEASRLCEENVILKQKIDALKEEDLKQLVHTMENLKKEKTASQKAAYDFKKQISELQSQSQRLEDKNGMLSDKNTQHISDMESLRQQLAALVKESERKEQMPTKDKTQLSACVSALEAELNKALDDTETLKQRNSLLSEQVCGLRDKVEKMDLLKRDLSSLAEEKKNLVKETQVLCNQLAKAQEKVKAADETVQTVTLQSSRLKADVRVLQQQKDSLQQDVSLLHKKLQNANDKNKVLEIALHSTGLQSHSKKVLREELARLLEQDQKIVKQENDRLQTEVLNVKGDLRQFREKVRQLDTTIVSLKQHKQAQSSQLMNLEKENMVLKQELEAQKEKTKGREAGGGLPDIERVLQENENLKSQMSHLSTQLIETFQAQLVGLLPPSPLRTPRGQHREEAENIQDERERKMKNMEERMREIELSLHNVKLLLKEKVAQLKDQLHKNGKADVLIKDLYVENDQLLKALEITEQRHKISEKKNYLLEEKISSLTKILRDLNPSTLPTLQYHFTCS